MTRGKLIPTIGKSNMLDAIKKQLQNSRIVIAVTCWQFYTNGRVDRIDNPGIASEWLFAPFHEIFSDQLTASVFEIKVNGQLVYVERTHTTAQMHYDFPKQYMLQLLK